MDNLSTIDIEGKTLALSSKELSKLTTPEGCHLKVVTDKVLNMDEDFYDDQDSENEFTLVDRGDHVEEMDTEATKRAREERMKREYISLVLNANNDPIKPGTKFRSRKFHQPVSETDNGEKNDTFSQITHDFDLGNLEEKHLGVHRMYEDLGKYDEYMKKQSFIELTPGLVYKMTRLPGVGEHTKVSEDSLVIYNCALWTEGSKEPFDSTWLRRTTLMSHLATDSILPGLRVLLLSSQQSELCEALIRPEAAFGRLGVMPRIPPNATIFCLLQVVRVVPQDKISKLLRTSGDQAEVTDDGGDSVLPSHLSALNFDDFYEASDEARRRGNYFYEHEQYKVALQRYKSAIRLLEGLSYHDEKQELQAKELLVKLYNNCARVSNAMGNPRGALAACKQASLIDDNVPKTHWHRMSAWALKGHPDRALGVARRAIQLFPDPKVSKPFIRAAERFKYNLQQEKIEIDELHRLMGRALISSAQPG